MGVAERRERELKRREQDILDAALRLFDEEGLQAVTIERIAADAEIGKGTVYLHFSSKEDICGRLASDFAERLRDRLRAVDPALPVVERLRRAIRIFFVAHREERRYQRVLDHCEHDEFRQRMGEGNRRRLEEVDAEIAGMIHAVLQEGIEQGVFPDRPIPALLYGAQSAVVGALRVMDTDCLGAAAAVDPVAEITRFVLAGLMFQDRVPAEEQSDVEPEVGR